MKKGVYLLFLICAAIILGGVAACNRPISNQEAEAEIPDTVSYNFNIRPYYLINVLNVMVRMPINARLV
jgi:hypothetical protein